MMTLETKKRSNFFILLALWAAMALAFAFAAEFWGGKPPCSLCIYQRYAIASVGSLSVLTLVWPLMRYVAVLALFVSLGLNSFHIGVEQKWWSPPETCTQGTKLPPNFQSLPDQEKIALLKRQRFVTPVPRCDEINWRILGISVTIWLELVLLLLFIGAVRCILLF